MSLKAYNRKRQLWSDPELVIRMRKCVESVHQGVEFGFIIRELHRKFPEYRRRKQAPFRQMVKQILRSINEDFEQPCEKGYSPGSSRLDNEIEKNVDSPNIMSNLLNNMYKKDKKRNQNRNRNCATKTSENAESIRSDESASISNELLYNNEDKSATSPPKKLKTSQDNHQGRYKETKRELEYVSDTSETVSDETADIIRNVKKAKYNEKTEDKGAKRTYKKSIDLQKSVINFRYLGGMNVLLKELCQILMQFKKPEIYCRLGVPPPKGILICGASGSGKTCLAYAIAGQLNVPIINVPALELIAGVTGESEERIRDIFEQAEASAPCVLFIDDVDTISGNRLNAQKEMERRIVGQLISCMDTLHMSKNGNKILIIGATTRPDSIDSALRRSGRFDHEISIPIPNREERREILRSMCSGLKTEPDLDYDTIAELTPGYLGADISALVSRAAVFAVKRKLLERISENHSAQKAENLYNNIGQNICSENTKSSTNPIRSNSPITIINEEPIEMQDNRDKIEISNQSWNPNLMQMIDQLQNPIEKGIVFDKLFITFEDFKATIEVLQPSLKREGFITVPNTSWDDIGSLHDIREELRLAILAPVKFSNEIKRFGLTLPSGVLLCGPPGCGKTLIAKAIANEAGINFLSIKGPELMSMYVGESERAVRDCFQRARNSAPCVIFFDEFDSLCPKRSDAHEGNSGIRVVNQLLTEMDGIEERKGVYVMAASNRPDIIDPAILRPGRLDTVLYVGMPNQEDRIDILRAATKNRTRPFLSTDVDFTALSKSTDGFTGADLTGLVRKAAMLSLKDFITKNQTESEGVCVHVTMEHFTEALRLFRPSITAQDLKIYEKMREKYAAPRFSIQNKTIK